MTVGSDGGSLTSIVLNCSSWLVVSLHKANVTTAPRVNKQHLTWLGGPAIPRLVAKDHLNINRFCFKWTACWLVGAPPGGSLRFGGPSK